MADEKKQVCSMQIMFPVDTDEEAIAYKKKVGEVLADIPNSRIEFRLTSIPKDFSRGLAHPA